MSRFHFNFSATFNASPKKRGNWAGWTQTTVDCGSGIGWNFFTRIRYWNKDKTDFLPPKTEFRIRTVEYYGEKIEKVWDFMTKKYNEYPAFEDKPRKERTPDTRFYIVTYRFPLLTISNAYNTELGIQRDRELDESFRKETEELDQALTKH